MSNYIYVSSMTGKGKDSGKAYNRITLIGKDRGGVRVWDLFTENGEKLPGQDELNFGDVVEAHFTTPDYPGARSVLSGLEPLELSPYDPATLSIK